MSFGPKSSAPFLAAMLVLWPIVAYIGAQGFTVAVAIAALCSLAYLRVKRIEIYAIAGSAFVLWVVASSFWAPEAKDLLQGNLLEGTFSMDMPGIRFGLTMLAGIGVLVAIGAALPGSARISLGVIIGAAIVQFVGVVVTALFMPEILALFAATSDPVREMPQNLMRNANAFALLMPFLLAWVWHRSSSVRWRIAALGIGLFSFVAFIFTGTQTALTGTLLMLICMAIVRYLPVNGLRILFSTVAFYIVAAPALLGWGLTQLRLIGVPLPKSFFSRSYSWELVGSKLGDAPLIGHGPEASHTWKDTYGDHPEWLADAASRYENANAWEAYPIIPIHPHNMPLQTWAETGMIGALLAAIFLFFVGWRVKPANEWSPVSRYAAAGLIGMCLAICSFSYSMWNEAYWASVMLVCAIILLQARHDGRSDA